MKIIFTTICFITVITLVLGTNTGIGHDLNQEKNQLENITQSERTISGCVTDENGNPLPGVNIVVKGTTVGTTTDSTGCYEITIPDGDVTLIFSFVGFESLEVPVNGRTVIDIVMDSSTQ